MDSITDKGQYAYMIECFIKQLDEDGIKCDEGIKGVLSKLFEKADKNKLYSSNIDERKNYAKDIAVKLEIQLMLDGGECVRREDVEKLYEDLLGDFPDASADINGFNVVAVIGEKSKIKKKDGGM